MAYFGEESTWREDGCYHCGRRTRMGTCSRCDIGDPDIYPEPTDEEIAWGWKEYHRMQRFKAYVASINAEYEANRDKHLAGYRLRQRTWRDR